MNRLQLKLIEEIEDNDGLLNDWERQRIDEWSRYEDRQLTVKQNHKLIEIHHKVVYGGR